MTAFVQGVESTRSDGALLLIFAVLRAGVGPDRGCFWCLAQAYVGTINLTLVDVLIFMGFVSFGAIVQIPGIGGGIQVVAVLVLTELFGAQAGTGHFVRHFYLDYFVCSNCSGGLGSGR